MAITVILHVSGELPIAGEVEELPKPTDNFIVVMNPRQRDGKDLHYLENNVTKVIWPINSISLMEILDTTEGEKIIGFVRD
jgi:hypothetical protein